MHWSDYHPVGVMVVADQTVEYPEWVAADREAACPEWVVAGKVVADQVWVAAGKEEECPAAEVIMETVV